MIRQLPHWRWLLVASTFNECRKLLKSPNVWFVIPNLFLEEHQELFTTLYAQRVFFLVTTEATGIKFEPIGRSEARLMLENRLRMLRRTGQHQEYDQLQKILQSTFQ